MASPSRSANALVSKWHPSVCTLDCPDTCSVSLEVVEGKIKKIRGSKINPYTRGAICSKVTQSYPAWVHGPKRLTTPLLRTNTSSKGERGMFRPISWEEALSYIHQRCQRAIESWGAECVLPLNYAGPHGLLAGGSMDSRFFHRMGATQVDRVPLCGGIRGEAYQSVFGNVAGMPPEQVAHAKLVVLWGANITVTHLHLVRHIQTAKRNGAKVVVIDPYHTKIAEKADLHLAVRPGEDLALAWALAMQLEKLDAFDIAFIDQHVKGAKAFMAQVKSMGFDAAIEHSGVSQTDLVQFAHWWKRGTPTAVVVGNGLERNRNGGGGIRSIFALSALTGRFGRAGNGVVCKAGNAFPTQMQALQCPDLMPLNPKGEPPRTINILDVPKVLLDKHASTPLKVVFIYNHNPIITHPNQNVLHKAFAQKDVFLVGIDVVMTESMELCDVILPACSQFEHGDIYPAYGQHWLQRSNAVIAPVGSSLPNTEIFRRLAKQFGYNEAALSASDADLMACALDWKDARMEANCLEELVVDKAHAMRCNQAPILLFDNVLPTTLSGRLELESDWLAKLHGEQARLPQRIAAPNEDARFPLTLISPASAKRINSIFGELSPSSETPSLHMHPEDAARRQLSEGELVRVFNTLGEVRAPLHITPHIRMGVVLQYKGAWLHTSQNEQTISALAPSHRADLSQGACFNDARVEVG